MSFPEGGARPLCHRRFGRECRRREDAMADRYDEVYARWRRDPEGFWAEAAEDVHWFRRWDRVLDYDRPPFARWFVGAETNTCFNAVDRHVEAGRGAQAAIVYDSPVTGAARR